MATGQESRAGDKTGRSDRVPAADCRCRRGRRRASRHRPARDAQSCSARSPARPRTAAGSIRQRSPQSRTCSALVQFKVLNRHRRDCSANADRRRRRRGRGVEHVDHPLRLDDAEVVDRLAVRVHRLGPHAGPGRVNVLPAELRNQPLQRLQERPLAERPVHLGQRPCRSTCGPSARSRGSRASATRPAAEAGPRVALAAEGEHGVRPGLDAAVDHSREVDAEEREPRVGHRVDQVLDQSTTAPAPARSTRRGTGRSARPDRRRTAAPRGRIASPAQLTRLRQATSPAVVVEHELGAGAAEADELGVEADVAAARSGPCRRTTPRPACSRRCRSPGRAARRRRRRAARARGSRLRSAGGCR